MLQELTAKEKGDWTPLMAAAESGSVDCFHEVLRAITERGSEERVSEHFRLFVFCRRGHSLGLAEVTR